MGERKRGEERRWRPRENLAIGTTRTMVARSEIRIPDHFRLNRPFRQPVSRVCLRFLSMP